MRSLAILVMLTLTACGGGSQQPLRTGMRPSLNVADAALSGGTPAIALQITSDLIAKEPTNVGALVRHGAALHALGRITEAQASYTRAITLNPASVDAALGLGRMQISSNPIEAERLFLQALNRDPRNPAALNNLGIARDLQGKHKDAQSAYAQAITEAPGMSAAQVNMGLSLALSGNPGRAVEMLRSLASQPAAPGPTRHNLAAAMAMSGDTANAESILRSDLSDEDARRALDAFRMLNEVPGATAQYTALPSAPQVTVSASRPQPAPPPRLEQSSAPPGELTGRTVPGPAPAWPQPASPAAAGTVEPSERVVTRQGANVRDAPNGGAAVARTASSGAVLRVFARTAGWVQVGDVSPWGWIHSSLLDPAP